MENQKSAIFGKYLGEKLTEYKEEKKLSLKELGDLLQVEPSYIHRIIKGERSNPGYQIVSTIIDVLGLNPVDVHEIALGKEVGGQMKDFAEFLKKQNLSVQDAMDIMKLHLQMKEQLEEIENRQKK